jgi:hypothetical protein
MKLFKLYLVKFWIDRFIEIGGPNHKLISKTVNCDMALTQCGSRHVVNPIGIFEYQQVTLLADEVAVIKQLLGGHSSAVHYNFFFETEHILKRVKTSLDDLDASQFCFH